ncbi:hypothetical protein R3W88_031705 [Solanum pinnatisectum]|uniref:Uncharacterized protein n=1 Tax=Solanum pinnatisectum TaxID=50273 RepID=A0AAV9LMG4_9SOLN|nr:hypothetical protein R3W88_031705 [Solanum pinnatisectum]
MGLCWSICRFKLKNTEPESSASNMVDARVGGRGWQSGRITVMLFQAAHFRMFK